MRRFFLMICMIAYSVLGAYGQDISTMGTDFWFTFMHNEDGNGANVIRVFISSDQNCTATITNPNANWSTTATVTTGQVSNVEIPIDYGRTLSSGVVTNTGLHLQASHNVSVYAATTGTWNYDVANVFPTSTLRDEYMVLSFPADRYPAEFAVVATENNTWVDIILSTAVAGHTAGDTISVFLPNAGKAYQLKSLAPGDFSGTIVKARDCKRIAVFHGDACLYVPTQPLGQSCDHVMEQAIPVKYWGRKFLVVPAIASLPDYVRITSLRDSCAVVKNGNTVATLDAGESYQYSISNQTQPDYIESSQPVSINVYFSSTGNGLGDPSMLTLNPIEQMVDNITFCSYTTNYTSTHRVNIITKTQNVMHMRLDGSNISSQFNVAQNNHEYSYARITVSAGSHTIRSLGGGGFNAYAYGLGSHESYAYSVGSSMTDISNQIFIEGEVASINDLYNACEGVPVHVSVVCEENPSYVVWDFGDGGSGVTTETTHIYHDTGLFEVTARMGFSINSCFSSNDTLHTYVHVWPNDTTVLNVQTDRCVFEWHGDTFADDGVYTHHLTGQYGCDSLLILNLSLRHNSDTTVMDVQTCDSEYGWYGETYTEDGTYTHLLTGYYRCDSLLVLNLSFHQPTESIVEAEGCDSLVVNGVAYNTDDTVFVSNLTNAAGCDSIVYYAIRIYPSYWKVQDITINEGDTLTWIDGRQYCQPTTSPMAYMTSIHGCDSNINLHLNVLASPEPPPVDSSVLWVPNAFTPELSTNREFKVFASDMKSVHVYIYTRQGLYVTDFDGLTQVWDGTRNGQPCKPEAYVYYIEYTTNAMPYYVNKKKGTVLLMR